MSRNKLVPAYCASPIMCKANVEQILELGHIKNMDDFRLYLALAFICSSSPGKEVSSTPRDSFVLDVSPPKFCKRIECVKI